MKNISSLLISLFASITMIGQSPNILLVIADDLGLDYSNSYHNSNLLPTTPTLDSLRTSGLTFMNAYATPKCTPTRGAIMSGKHGIKTGVQDAPGNLDTSHTSIFKAIEEQTNGLYSDAVIGKWHISHPSNANHPYEHGADYYTGLLEADVTNYYAWEHTYNGVEVIDTNYATSVLTDSSIQWINDQDQPWFLWLAHVAPHGPFHVPPDSLYSIKNTGTNGRKYIAMIEAMDHELGRLLHSIPTDERNNTVIIYIGDNGTPNSVLQNYPSGHGKSTLYQGGIHIPMFVSGPGITRVGETEDALVNVIDIYATLLELTGADLPGGIYNSLSFKHLLDDSPGAVRDYNYSEIANTTTDEYTIRDLQYKLIESNTTSTQQFYDLINDSLETEDLMLVGLTDDQQLIKADLETEAAQLRNSWSCRDHIQNGDETGIDCGGTSCGSCSTTNVNDNVSTNNVTIFPNPTDNKLTVINKEANYSIEVFNVYGENTNSYYSANKETTLDISGFIKGVYFIKITNTSNTNTYTHKITKT